MSDDDNNAEWDYYQKLRRKFKDDDKDGFDDNWEQKVGLHDENNRHKLPHFSMAPAMYHRKGIIGIHHDGLKSFAGPMKSLKMNEMKPMKLKVEMKQPHLKSNLKSVSIPTSKLDDSRIKTPVMTFRDDFMNDFLERVSIRRKKKR